MASSHGVVGNAATTPDGPANAPPSPPFRCEPASRYSEGGFCPIDLGDRILNRFTILHKLGYGRDSTIWLVSDDKKRHGQYVALKVMAACTSRKKYGQMERVKKRIRHYERKHHSPGLFVMEFGSFWHTSANGEHLCQVLPVVGPTLDSLNSDYDDDEDPRLLYASFVKDFARQLVRAVETLHGEFKLMHRDLRPSVVALKLAKPLDSLSEVDLARIFSGSARGTPKTPVPFPAITSAAPKYANPVVDLALLPREYVSDRLCIFGFESSFLYPGQGVAQRTDLHCLAPETIFERNYGPWSDIWALGIILFQLRVPAGHPFLEYAETRNILSLVRGMVAALGDLPSQWKTLKFDLESGNPIREPQPEEGVEYTDFASIDPIDPAPLEEAVNAIREAQRPKDHKSETARDEFCLPLPKSFDPPHPSEYEWYRQNTTKIESEDAALFAHLMRRMFDYVYGKPIEERSRYAAWEVLDHPWTQDRLVHKRVSGIRGRKWY